MAINDGFWNKWQKIDDETNAFAWTNANKNLVGWWENICVFECVLGSMWLWQCTIEIGFIIQVVDSKDIFLNSLWKFMKQSIVRWKIANRILMFVRVTGYW